jgi:ketosteroid isomerase-like protein
MDRDPDANRRLVGRCFDLPNESDLSTLEEILFPVCRLLGPRAPDGVRGPEAFCKLIATLRRDAPDLRFTERETVAEGDRVASVFTMTRTHRTNEDQTKTIVTEGMDLFRIAGKINEVNAYFDRLGLLVETGMFEPPRGA